MVHRQFKWERGDVQKWKVEKVPSFFGFAPCTVFTIEGISVMNMWKGTQVVVFIWWFQSAKLNQSPIWELLRPSGRCFGSVSCVWAAALELSLLLVILFSQSQTVSNGHSSPHQPERKTEFWRLELSLLAGFFFRLSTLCFGSWEIVTNKEKRLKKWNSKNPPYLFKYNASPLLPTLNPSEILCKIMAVSNRISPPMWTQLWKLWSGRTTLWSYLPKGCDGKLCGNCVCCLQHAGSVH